MISYPIDAAQQTGLFDHIIVSTDDNEIADVAKACGAEIPFMRPTELADDFTGTVPVTNHAIRWLLDNDIQVDYVCCIYATTPLIQPFYLNKAFNLLKESSKLFAFSTCTFPFPVQRALRRLENGGNEPMWPEYIGSRSQDLEEAIHDAGQFYWGTVDAFLKGHSTFSPKSIPVILPRYLVQDIDTEDDWQYAEYMYEILRNNNFRTS